VEGRVVLLVERVGLRLDGDAARPLGLCHGCSGEDLRVRRKSCCSCSLKMIESKTVSSTISVANLHDNYVCRPTDTQKRVNYIDQLRIPCVSIYPATQLNIFL
jgi:hypothetical protein